MQDQGQVRVGLDEIHLGAKCKFDIYDDNGVLLLGNGRPFTDVVRAQVMDRGVSFLEVDPEDAKALRGQTSERKSLQSDKKREATVATSNGPVGRIDRVTESYSADRGKAFAAQVKVAVGQVAQIGSEIDQLGNDNVDDLCGIPEGMLEMLVEDADQSIATVQAERHEDRLASRCARMSMLAINTGIEMKFSAAEVVQLGTAGLMHDLGLYQFPRHYRDVRTRLSDDDAWQYRRHCAVGTDLISPFRMVSDETRLIMHQVHERADGSGYPRGLHGRLIHPLANILAVVDSYLTLTDPGPDRPGVIPHDAIVFLLHQVGRGVLNAESMRAFLKQITLFPIGSRVELDNGTIATVTRRNSEHYSMPILSFDDGTDQLVPLSELDQKIVRPVVDDPIDQMRLTGDAARSMTLEMLEPSLA